MSHPSTSSAHASVLAPSQALPKDSVHVKGPDFSHPVDLQQLLSSYEAIGFQATGLARAVQIVEEMRQRRLDSNEPLTLFLGYTSNLISSGLREILRFLAQHKLIDCIVTTAGGIEEDFVKCLGSTVLGEFHLDGAELRKKGLNRIGNLLVPNSNYCSFEDWVVPILDQLVAEQEGPEKTRWSPSSVIRRLGKEINNEESVYYWCYKNDIPVFCPALTDGSLGDMIYFHTYKTEHQLTIDIVADIRRLNDILQMQCYLETEQIMQYISTPAKNMMALILARDQMKPFRGAKYELVRRASRCTQMRPWCSHWWWLRHSAKHIGRHRQTTRFSRTGKPLNTFTAPCPFIHVHHVVASKHQSTDTFGTNITRYYALDHRLYVPCVVRARRVVDDTIRPSVTSYSSPLTVSFSSALRHRESMAAPAPRSAAIQIVRPNASAPAFKPAAQAQAQTQTQPQIPASVASPVDKKRADNTQRLCRNVLIYGTCKYQDQGCPFYHPPPGVDPTLLETAVPNPLQSPLPGTPVSQAIQDAPKLSNLGVAAPVFVPKTPNPVPDVSPRSSTPSVHPGHLWPQASGTGLLGSTDGSAMGYDEGMLGSHHAAMESSMYMAQPARHTLDYHLYAAPLPHVSNLPLSTAPLHSFFISDDLRRVLQSRQDAIHSLPSGSTGLPAELGVYHSLLPLGSHVSAPSRVWGHPSPVYRATSGMDGNVYALRRIEGFKLVNEQAFGAIDTWRRLRHPNIVGLREAFTTKAFNDNSLILVYDYHPDSTTLLDEHLAPDPPPRPQKNPRQGMPVPERVLWSYITQIANAIKAIHASGMAVRGLDMSKVLITGKNRIRVNGCGIMDVLAYDANTPIAMFQQDDLVSFGKLILHLACEFFQPGQHPSTPLDHIARHYSPDLKNIVLFLISKPQPSKTIDDVIRLSGMRMLNELDAMQMYVDVLEAELGGEIENGRLVRLLVKLGFINERAEFELDPRWSDTGDRYILKLFRDFVFHSIGVDGNPVLDLSHVLTCLNKLDAGLDERIMLVSRDDQSCLVVSYREIKSCIEAAYSELRNAGNPMRGLR